MGLFVRKKYGNLSGIINEESIGFDAIEKHFSKIHQNNINPRHFCPKVPWRFGGSDPLDEVDVYEDDEYYHFVTYGLSELYEKHNDIKDISGYGMEFTLKLKNDKNVDGDKVENLVGVLQDIARITFTEGELFKKNEFIDFGDNLFDSNICGFITGIDKDAGIINTKNGRVEFVILVGVCKEELDAIKRKDITVKELFDRKGEITKYK